MEKEKPIGVFDSGIGGLTVVKRLASALPNENIIYFGDTARVPYGSKSNSTVIEYAIQDAKFLMNKNVKAIVVACNTVSSVALNELGKHFDVPIIGMIEPGAEYALSHTENGKIGVIGTRSTISNSAYALALKKHNPKLEVFMFCPNNRPSSSTYSTPQYTKPASLEEEYLLELRENGIDTLVLGCTHYPILAEIIQKVIGEKVKLVDSGIASAEVVRNELNRIGFETNSRGLGHQEYYVSDIPAKFKEVAELFLGRPVKDVHKVDIEQIV